MKKVRTITNNEQSDEKTIKELKEFTSILEDEINFLRFTISEHEDEITKQTNDIEDLEKTIFKHKQFIQYFKDSPEFELFKKRIQEQNK